MELEGERGSPLGEEDSPYIVKEQIQPLSTNSAREERYYRTRHAVLPLARQGLYQTCSAEAESGRTTGAVLPRPLAVLP